MSSIGYIQGLGGKGGYPPNWSELNYSTTPQPVINAFDYAKQIQANWVVGSHPNQFLNDKKLYFFPSGLDLMGTNSYADMFRGSNLMYIPPITLGFISGSYGNTSLAGMFRDTNIEEITILGVKNTAGTDDTHYYNDCFNGCKNLKVANINSNPKLGVGGMFYGCSALETITGLNTTGTQAFNSMYYGCTSLTNPPLLDLSSATQINQMHYGCTSLVNSPEYVTTNVANASEMFRNCTALVTAPSFNFGNATNVSNIFNSCTALENVPIYNFTKNVNMSDMFINCTSLTDISRDNILQMCANATAYTGTKTLYRLGFRNTMYSAASWQALTHYSDFTSAGWTIGYS